MARVAVLLNVSRGSHRVSQVERAQEGESLTTANGTNFMVLD
jgi:hypothetical protein